MKYNDLTLRKNKKLHRVGRGISAGQGKTAGRGTKGQGSRAGSGRKPGFAGGQIKLTQALPKLRGFKAVKAKAEVVYTGDLSLFKGNVTNMTLFEKGLIKQAYGRAKIVVRGDVTSKVDVRLQGASANAIEMIQKAGGSFTTIDRVARLAKPKTEPAATTKGKTSRAKQTAK